MNAAVAAAVGMLIMAGLFFVAYGWQRRLQSERREETSSLGSLWARLSRRPVGKRGRRRDMILLGSLVLGVLAAALTGWVIAIAVLPALALGLPSLLSTPKSRDVELLEALDRWVRSLSATLPTGRSITDAIRLSRRTAPELLQAELSILVARLNARWETRDALMRFADALDSPDADGVVAALILAANRGSNGTAATLTALADSLQVQLRGRRVIETERAKPYIVVRQVTVITLGTLGVALLIGKDFFAPYHSALGQLILVVLITAYAGSLAFMRRRARPRDRQRILVAVHR